MTTETLTLADFLLARIAEDEAVAQAAIQTRGATHWHWADHDTDEPVEPKPFEDEFVGGYERRMDLRTVEKLSPVPWEGGEPLPDFILPYAEEVPAAAGLHIARHDPARVLAECEARRRLVNYAAFMLKAWEDKPGGAYPDMTRRERHTANVMLAALALPYEGHPDYDESWRP